MDTAGFKFAKPGDVGRTKVVKLSRGGYALQKRKVWERQIRSCADCGRGISLEQMELHHESREGFAGKVSHGRGLGGGKRNDLKTRGLCSWCHGKAEEKKR